MGNKEQDQEAYKLQETYKKAKTYWSDKKASLVIAWETRLSESDLESFRESNRDSKVEIFDEGEGWIKLMSSFDIWPGDISTVTPPLKVFGCQIARLSVKNGDFSTTIWEPSMARSHRSRPPNRSPRESSSGSHSDQQRADDPSATPTADKATEQAPR